MAKKNAKHTSIGTIIFAILMIAIIVFGILYLATHIESHDGDGMEQPVTPTTDTKDIDITGKEQINTSSPDKDDEKDIYEQSKPQQNAAPTTEKKKASFNLRIAENDELAILSATITNFKEEGGSCTYKVSNSNTTNTYSAVVLPDAKYTICEAKQIKKSDLSAGTWTVTVSYSSATAEGVSSPQSFTIK